MYAEPAVVLLYRSTAVLVDELRVAHKRASGGVDVLRYGSLQYRPTPAAEGRVKPGWSNRQAGRTFGYFQMGGGG